MAVVYNNIVCVSANDLIKFNPKTNIGSELGFMPEGTYYYKVTRGYIVIVRRGGSGQSALVEFNTMEEKVKQQYISIYGNPIEEIERSKSGLLESTLKYNESAYTFFSTEYRDENGCKLSPEKASLYTLQSRMEKPLNFDPFGQIE